MTLDEAIRHCIYEVYLNQMRGCDECAAEHEQLAEWLTELKQRREAEISDKPKTNADRIRQMTDEELVKSIGFACKRCAYYKVGHGECSGQDKECTDGNLEWLRKEADEDAAERTH